VSSVEPSIDDDQLRSIPNSRARCQSPPDRGSTVVGVHDDDLALCRFATGPVATSGISLAARVCIVVRFAQNDLPFPQPFEAGQIESGGRQRLSRKAAAPDCPPQPQRARCHPIRRWRRSRC